MFDLYVLSFYHDVSHTETCAFEIVNQETSKVWWFFSNVFHFFSCSLSSLRLFCARSLALSRKKTTEHVHFTFLSMILSYPLSPSHSLPTAFPFSTRSPSLFISSATVVRLRSCVFMFKKNPVRRVCLYACVCVCVFMLTKERGKLCEEKEKKKTAKITRMSSYTFRLVTCIRDQWIISNRSYLILH